VHFSSLPLCVSYQTGGKKLQAAEDGRCSALTRAEDVIPLWLANKAGGIAQREAGLSAVEDEGDDGGAGGCSGGYGCLIEGAGTLFRGGRDRCLSDLLRCRGLEAEFADPISFASSDGRPEDAAGLRPPCVEITGAVLGIESGAGLVVGEVFKSVHRIAAGVQLQCAGGRVARKLRRKAGP
jgi:hypothetical protein